MLPSPKACEECLFYVRPPADGEDGACQLAGTGLRICTSIVRLLPILAVIA